jgi:hypothetical protein
LAANPEHKQVSTSTIVTETKQNLENKTQWIATEVTAA